MNLHGKNPYGMDDGYFRVKNVIFPKNLQEIGDYALVDIDVTSLEIPSSVKKIGKFAFAYSNLPQELKLPLGLEFIDAYAFFKTTGIKSVKIPSNVKSLSEGVFKRYK